MCRPADVNSTPAPTIVDDDSFEKELCKAKEAGEWFRLQAGDGDNCRDVIQCTSSVRLPSNDIYSSSVYLMVSFLHFHEYLGTASYPLPSWSRFRYRETDMRLERTSQKLSQERKGT